MTAYAPTLALGLLLAATPALAQPLAPFGADYAVRYGAMSVGSSHFELRADGAPGRWVFESRSTPSGFGRLVTGGTLVQTSWLVVAGADVRPLRFRFDDGARRRSEDVSLTFDWERGRVAGEAKGEAVDLPLEPGMQDPVSSQLALMVELLAGGEPRNHVMIDGGRLRPTELRFERRERVTTPAGEFETLVYTSRRTGGSRVTWMWLAPQLQYLPVRMEQMRREKRYFSMELERHRPGG